MRSMNNYDYAPQYRQLVHDLVTPQMTVVITHYQVKTTEVQIRGILLYYINRR